ncbi:MAG TPA: NAD(P)-dependent alcohol dehydrogenase [Bacteroidales bacterium]|nr:NAD(P)-dependent alcohol dehydrogenase [Bacteroidales bacterium]
MKAVVYNKSVTDKLEFNEVKKPIPNDNEVLIKVISVSLNAADYRSMQMHIIPKRRIFGADISGRVEAVGKNISLFKAGDEVIGELSGYGFGGMAEYVTSTEKFLVKKPSNISFEEAAVLPIAAMTALQGLRNIANVQAGQKVLIVGCSGGVGTFAVQLAKYMGAEVTGVCSSKNIMQTLSLGAGKAIDYSKNDFFKNEESYDAILAINGGYPLTAYKRLLAPNGIFVMVGGSLSQIFKTIVFGRLFSFGSKKMRSLAAKADTKDLEFLAGLMSKGLIKPVIEKRFSFDESIDAMNYIKQGHSRGKVVINIASVS